MRLIASQPSENKPKNDSSTGDKKTYSWPTE
jgi:hypothetical protein